MSRYWKKCPHCRHTIEEGYGFLIKQLGDPKKNCHFCSRPYIDNSYIDWKKASVSSKILYFFANGRFFLCFLLSMISVGILTTKTEWNNWQIFLVALAVFTIAFIPCALYVKHQVKIYLLIYGVYEGEKKIDSSVDLYAKYKDGLFSNHKAENNKNRRRR